ncbi:MAG: response regulator, partial [Thermoleophilia bacterium]|nr:response regulator [Thermoleophilia bacterium]
VLGADLELVTLPAEEQCAVSVDPTELHQPLLNLCVNARDAMPDGGRLTIATGVERRDATDYAFLRVTDTSTGISPELVPHVFEPFVTTKDAGQGTGLGLAMVNEFVLDCDGLAELETAPGTGTTFTLLLPRVECPAGAPAQGGAAAAKAGSETILLIEDDDAVRAIARRVLGGAGYTVVEARYGSEALELAEGDLALDAVLSDVVMPGLSGPEVVGRLQALRPELGAVFMSGYAPESMGSLRGHELVRKPFTAPQLLEAVRRALDGRSAVAA